MCHSEGGRPCAPRVRPAWPKYINKQTNKKHELIPGLGHLHCLAQGHSIEMEAQKRERDPFLLEGTWETSGGGTCD